MQDKPTQYEYLRVGSFDLSIGELNRLGKQGWTLCDVWRSTENGTSVFTFVRERPRGRTRKAVK